MRQEPSHYPPELHGAPVTDHDVAESASGGEQAKREFDRIGQGAGPAADFSEKEKDVISLSRFTKKKIPALLAGALLAFLAAGALGGYLLSAKRGERGPPHIQTPVPPAQTTRDSAGQERPSHPGLKSTEIPTPAEVPSPVQAPTSRESAAGENRRAKNTETQPYEKTAREETAKTGRNVVSDDVERMDDSENQDDETHEGYTTDKDGDDLSDEGTELMEAIKSLDSALEKFETVWSKASEAVHAAFAANYMARTADDSPVDPLGFFRRQASISKRDAQDCGKSSSKYSNALMDVQFVRTLLMAASSRTELLCEIEKLCDASGIGSALLGREAAPLLPQSALKIYPSQATFEDFMVMLKGFAFRVNEKALEEAGTVPTVLAKRLAASVKLETLQLENDRVVHSHFQKFALELPYNEVHIVHSNGTTFGTKPLLHALGRAINEREANILTAQALGSWIEDWDIDGVIGRIALNEEDMQHVLGMRLTSYVAASPDDIFSAALALI